MKKILLLLSISFSFSIFSQVQIPDPNFAAFLEQTYPGCMTGNTLNISMVMYDDSLDCSGQNISNLSGIQYFQNLRYLDCSNNQLVNLPLSPDITGLSMFYLDCSHNQLTELDSLPYGLYEMYCGYNLLTSLPTLSYEMEILHCEHNQLTTLPNLTFLKGLDCSFNSLTSIPQLGYFLKYLHCQNNQIANFESPNAFGIDLEYVWCQNNQLTELPWLTSSSLRQIICSNNLLTSISALPNYLESFYCSDNQLTCLPYVPLTVFEGDASGNPLSCIPNPRTWLPALPVCDAENALENPNNCIATDGIIGTIYKDQNQDCIFNSGDEGVDYMNITALRMVDTVYFNYNSFTEGGYRFDVESGSYKIFLNLDNVPFFTLCNEDTILVNLESDIELAQHVDFAIGCSGFDIGAQSVSTTGFVFPGQTHAMRVLAGDLSQWYGDDFQCGLGESGEVIVTVNGPVTYAGNMNGTLVPSINGNVFTYSIADFGLTDYTHDFGLLFLTDTTALQGDEICVSVQVTDLVGDVDASNNTLNYCYPVVNSYDPNIKEVYPVNVEPGFDDWLTYTIHFQNTGNAPAFNIRLLDTLDAEHLDVSTFKVTAYSHANSVTRFQDVVTVKYNNIMLTDSTTDFEGSIGYVQYQIKPKSGLPLGTVIENTAYIYFDFNEPIVTNTTHNEYMEITGIDENFDELTVSMFPNPAENSISIHCKEKITDCKIYDVSGNLIAVYNPNTFKAELEISGISNGLYLVEVSTENNTKMLQFVKCTK